MNRKSFMAVGIAAALALASVVGSVSASGGSGGGGGGGTPAPTGGKSGGGGGALCFKASAQAFQAFSYYSSLTLSSTLQNCSSNVVSGSVSFAATSASSACTAEVASAYQPTFSLPANTRTSPSASVYAPDCTPSDQITATVTTKDGLVLASIVATWNTGVTP
jgi:hypothetical protein